MRALQRAPLPRRDSHQVLRRRGRAEGGRLVRSNPLLHAPSANRTLTHIELLLLRVSQPRVRVSPRQVRTLLHVPVIAVLRLCGHVQGRGAARRLRLPAQGERQAVRLQLRAQLQRHPRRGARAPRPVPRLAPWRPPRQRATLPTAARARRRRTTGSRRRAPRPSTRSPSSSTSGDGRSPSTTAPSEHARRPQRPRSPPRSSPSSRLAAAAVCPPHQTLACVSPP